MVRKFLPTSLITGAAFPTARLARPTRWWLLLPMLLLLVHSAFSGHLPLSSIRYVKPTATGTGDGSSWANASGNLQAMINNSLTNDQVWVAAGTYKPTTGNSRSDSFAMKNGVAIYGGFAGSETNLSDRPAISLTSPSATMLSGDIGTVGNAADNSYHVIFNPAGLTNTAILDGFVITGGNANGDVDDDYGGGVYNDVRGSGQVCSPTLTNCSFLSNAALLGGAMFNGGRSGTSSPTLTNCAFQSNSAQLGGAMYNDGSFSGTSSPTLTNCSFLSNSASGNGGAVYNKGYLGTSSPTLTNCSFLSNSASGVGGAMYNLGAFGTSSPTLTNCVFFDNGGANTFVNDAASVLTSYSLFDASVTGYAASSTNLTTTVSPFASPTSVALNACAPAIDAGNNTAPGLSGLTPDLAGNPRVFGGMVDMGAVESQTTPNRPTVLTTQPAMGSAVCAGSRVAVAVLASGTPATPGGPLAYAWYKGSTLLTGQTSATLTLTSVSSADAGSYSAVVTGTCNSVTSTAFSLTVNESPAAPTLTGSPRTVEPGQTPLPLSPFVNADNGNTLSFSGVNGAIANPATANVSQVGVQSFSVTQANASSCVSGVTAFTITVRPATPANQTICRSGSVVLKAITTGSRYEWYRNGKTIANRLSEVANVYVGTKTASLTLVNAQAGGTFYCKVFAADGSFVFDGPYAVLVDFSCTTPGARVAASAEVRIEVPLSVVLLPNPVVGGQLRAVVRGAEGQALTAELVDLQGQVRQQQQWSVAETAQAVEWSISERPAGLYLLRVQTPRQVTTVKVIHQE